MTGRSRLLSLALVAAAPPAFAVTATQVTVNAAGGYTDNATSAPSQVAARPRNADLFFTVSPSLHLSQEGPRLVKNLSLSVGMSRYASETEANSLSAHGSLGLSYQLTPVWTSVTSVSGDFSKVSALDALDVVGAVPPGGGKVVSVGASTSLGRDFSATQRGILDLSGGVHIPVGEAQTTPRSYNVDAGVSGHLSRRRDAFELRLSAGLNRYDQTGTLAVKGQNELHQAATLTWLRELTPFWKVSAGGGGTLVEKEGASPSPQLLAHGTLSYRKRETGASLSLNQSASGNPLLGQTFSVTDGVVRVETLAGRFLLSADGGVSHSTPIGAASSTSIDTAHFSTTVGLQLTETMYVTAHHEMIYQVSHPDGAADQRLVRNAVTLGLTAFFPRYAPSATPVGIVLGVRQSEERDAAEDDR